MAEGKLYSIKVENAPSGAADVYVNHVYKVSFTGPNAIQNAAEYISKLQDEDKTE